MVNTRSNETETEVQRRVTCMWHVYELGEEW